MIPHEWSISELPGSSGDIEALVMSLEHYYADPEVSDHVVIVPENSPN